MKKSIFLRTPSQHEGTVTFMHNYINTMISEGSLTNYAGDRLHFEINQYHLNNERQALEEFCNGINAHVSQELEKVLNATSSSFKLF